MRLSDHTVDRAQVLDQLNRAVGLGAPRASVSALEQLQAVLVAQRSDLGDAAETRPEDRHEVDELSLYRPLSLQVTLPLFEVLSAPTPDERVRREVVAILARLLLEAAGAARSGEVDDDSTP